MGNLWAGHSLARHRARRRANRGACPDHTKDWSKEGANDPSARWRCADGVGIAKGTSKSVKWSHDASIRACDLLPSLYVLVKVLGIAVDNNSISASPVILLVSHRIALYLSFFVPLSLPSRAACVPILELACFSTPIEA